MAAPPPPPPDLDPEWAAQDRAPAVIASIVVVTALSTLFVAARLYVRGGIIKRLQPDDYIIMVSLVRHDPEPSV